MFRSGNYKKFKIMNFLGTIRVKSVGADGSEQGKFFPRFFCSLQILYRQAFVHNVFHYFFVTNCLAQGLH